MKIVKLDDTEVLAHVRQYLENRDASFQAATALQKEVETKLEMMKNQFQEVHAEFWKYLGTVAPQTTEGNWQIETDYISEGLVFLKSKDDEASEDEMPSPIRSLLQALEGKGVNVGLAQVNVRKVKGE